MAALAAATVQLKRVEETRVNIYSVTVLGCFSFYIDVPIATLAVFLAFTLALLCKPKQTIECLLTG